MQRLESNSLSSNSTSKNNEDSRKRATVKGNLISSPDRWESLQLRLNKSPTQTITINGKFNQVRKASFWVSLRKNS